MRENPDLDDVFLGSPSSDGVKSKTRRRRKTGITADLVRRYAYKVLNILATLDASARRRVLAKASKIERSQ